MPQSLGPLVRAVLFNVVTVVCVLRESPGGVRVGLHNSNLLLRSCTFRNSESAVGIVVYAGEEEIVIPGFECIHNMGFVLAFFSYLDMVNMRCFGNVTFFLHIVNKVSPTET